MVMLISSNEEFLVISFDYTIHDKRTFPECTASSQPKCIYISIENFQRHQVGMNFVKLLRIQQLM